LARVGRHGLNFLSAAVRTGKHRFKDHRKRPPTTSKHVADIGRARGIREYRLLDLIGGQVVADCETKDVDDFVGVRADDMRTKNASGLIVYQSLVAGDAFGNPPRRIPVRGLFALSV